MHFHRWLTLGFLLAAMAGMFAGTALAKRLSAAVLRSGFALCVVLLGLMLVARAVQNARAGAPGAEASFCETNLN